MAYVFWFLFDVQVMKMVKSLFQYGVISMKKYVYAICAALSFLIPGAVNAENQQSVAQVELVASTDQQMNEKLESLLSLFKQRLDVINDVARWKWNNTYPIEDPAREKAMFEEIGKQAESLGLNPEQAKDIFLAQVNAEKLLQILNFEKWVEEDADLVDEAPDLTVLNPKIDALNAQILAKLADILPQISQDQFSDMLKAKADAIVTGNLIDDSVRDAVIEPFMHAKHSQQIVNK